MQSIFCLSTLSQYTFTRVKVTIRMQVEQLQRCKGWLFLSSSWKENAQLHNFPHFSQLVLKSGHLFTPYKQPLLHPAPRTAPFLCRQASPSQSQTWQGPAKKNWSLGLVLLKLRQDLDNWPLSIRNGHWEAEKEYIQCLACRRSDIRFGIWDLPRKVTTKAKFGPLGQNWDFFGTIFGPFRDF